MWQGVFQRSIHPPLQEIQQDAQDLAEELSKLSGVVENYSALVHHLGDKMASYEPTNLPNHRPPPVKHTDNSHLHASLQAMSHRIAALSSSTDQLCNRLQHLQHHSVSFADQYDNMIGWFEKAYDVIHTLQEAPDEQVLHSGSDSECYLCIERKYTYTFTDTHTQTNTHTHTPTHLRVPNRTKTTYRSCDRRC